VSIDTLFLTPVYLPLFCAAFLMAAKVFFPERTMLFFQGVAGVVGLLLPLAALFLLNPFVMSQQNMETVIGAWETSIGIHYHFDGLSYLLIALHLAVSIPIYLYRKKGQRHSDTFAIVFFIQCSSVAATSLTADLFNLFVCLEVMGITSYVLIASSDKEQSILASYNYLMFSATAMVFFLIGVFGLYRITGSLSYEAIASVKNSLVGSELLVAQFSLVLIVISTLLRSAIVPLSGWLVGAHSTAPHPVSALLSGVLIKVPLFALVRLLLLVVGSYRIGSVLAFAGGLSAIVGILFALRENHAKRLLAYSSVSQIGYVVTAYALAVKEGIGTERGALLLSLALLYAFCHAVAKALLFLTVGTATDALNTKDLALARGANQALKAQGEKIPLTCISFFIAFLSLAALPPTIGYFGKSALLSVTKGHIANQMLTITSVLTVVAYLKLCAIFFPSKEKIKTVAQEKSIGFSLRCAFYIFDFLLIAGFFFYKHLQNWVIQILSPLGSSQIQVSLFAPYSDFTKSLVTIIIAIVVYRLYHTALAHKLLSFVPNKGRTFSDLFFGYGLAIAIMAFQLIR